MKRVALLLLGLVCLLGLTSCGPSENQKAIYHDDAAIARQSDSYYYVKHLSNTKNDQYDASFASFTGSDTCWSQRIGADGAQFSLSVVSTVSSGSWKLVLIAPDDTVTMIAEGSAEEGFETLLTEGTWRIKSVGLECEGNFLFSIGLD